MYLCFNNGLPSVNIIFHLISHVSRDQLVSRLQYITHNNFFVGSRYINYIQLLIFQSGLTGLGLNLVETLLEYKMLFHFPVAPFLLITVTQEKSKHWNQAGYILSDRDIRTYLANKRFFFLDLRKRAITRFLLLQDRTAGLT